MKIDGRMILSGKGLFGQEETDVADRIAEKKQRYQKQGMKIVRDARKGEKQIDQSIEDSKERVRAMLDENDAANAEINEIHAKEEQAKKDFGIGDEDQEQKDLELLKKQQDILSNRSNDTLTEEEQKRLDEMGSPTEYQRYALELHGRESVLRDSMEKNEEKMSSEVRTVHMVKIERLKSHAILDAQKSKDELMQSASQEAISMLMDDVKEKIDEKVEEEQEKANDRKEEKEEEEARIEAAKEDQTQAEAAAEKSKENISDMTSDITDSQMQEQSVSQEVQKIMQEQKLLEEDLKGIALDAKA